jgi:hypothetical protein
MKLPYTEEELTGGDSFNGVQIAGNPVTNPYAAQPAQVPERWPNALNNNGLPTTYSGMPISNPLAPGSVLPPLPIYSTQIYQSQPPAYASNTYPVPVPVATGFDVDGVREVPFQVHRVRIVNGTTVNYVETNKAYMTEDFARFNDEAAAKAHAETLKLTKQYHQEKDAAAKAKTREALIEAVNKEFAAMRESRLKEIDELQKKLEEVKATVAKRDEVKDKIIERRVEHLLGVDPLYQWDSDNVNFGQAPTSNYVGPQGNSFSIE